MGRLDGKVAIISGGARGQGAAEARIFAREGAKVVIGDILDEAGKQVEAEIRGSGGEATFVHLDVTRDADWRDAVQTARSNYGKLDILVNNAAIMVRKRIEDTSEEEWDRIMAVNAKGVFLGTKHAIPAMREAGGGSIVNIGSTGAHIAVADGSASYPPSKAAVRLLTKVTALQHAKDGIRCNCVHPGPTDSPMIQGALADANGRERIGRIPIGRIAAPEEIAYGVLYMASDESSFTTGSDLLIDGGVTAE